MLLHNRTLRHLDLSGNGVGLRGAKLLQDAALKRVLRPEVVLYVPAASGAAATGLGGKAPCREGDPGPEVLLAEAATSCTPLLGTGND